MKKLILPGIVLVSLVFIATAFGLNKTETIHESQRKKNEKELNVEVHYALGEFILHKSKSNELYNVTLEYDPENLQPKILYEVRDRKGFLKVTGDNDDERSGRIRNKKVNKWDVKLNPDLPTKLSVDVGLGDGVVDLGGMNVTEMDFSNGLSSTELDFSEPVKNGVDEIELETGLGKLRAKNLGNAKFKELSFSCGLGSATLDFHGVNSERSEVAVEVGLGTVTLILPKDLGVRIEAERSFLSGVSMDREFREKDGYYYTENWNDAKKQMEMELTVGLGSVNVERID